MKEQTQTLSQLTGKKTISNPADLLPKKKVEQRDSITDALGDLGLVIQKENEETRKLAEAMIEDMKKARAMGKEPQFRTDELAMEGMQPIEINRDLRATPGIDSNIPSDGPIKLRPSDALDINSISSIKNYIEPPIYTNSCNVFTDPVVTLDIETSGGPRSVLMDNNEINIDEIKHQRENNKIQEQSKPTTFNDEVDPDDDSDLMLLLAQEFNE